MKLKSIPEVKRLSLDVQAAAAIRSQILNGNLGPGTRFTEAAISEQMGLSRGTIRSALHQLSAEGIVTQTPYTAWEVTSLDAHDAWELYTLRGNMEGLAARLAAEMIEDAGRRELDKALGVLRNACKTGDAQGVANADLGLHKSIISLSRHRRLGEQYRLVELQVRMLIASSNDLVPKIDKVLSSHVPIVKAIKAGDAALAEQLSRDFNKEHGAQLVSFLQNAH